MAVRDRLTVTQIKAAKPGKAKRRMSDGGNLYLVVKPSGAKSWVFLYKDAGRPVERGLGTFPDMTLKAARELAARLRAARAAGESLEPILNPTKGMTFGEAARGAYEKRLPTFRSRHTIRQWETDLFKRLAKWDSKPVQEIDLPAVSKELRPVMEKTPESGRRFQTRIEAAFSYAIAMGEYEGANPARWKDGLQNVMPKRSKPVKHYRAMPYRDVPGLMDILGESKALSARCLAFTILTAARTSQARGARWDEIDMDRAVWTVPPNRMKAKRVHLVPLSTAALEVLGPLHEWRSDPFVFASGGREGHLSDGAMLSLLLRMGLRGKDHDDPISVHGFRATLMEWMEAETAYPRDLAEHALSHAVGTAAFRAYARGSELEKRRPVMEAWGDFATRGSE